MLSKIQWGRSQRNLWLDLHGNFHCTVYIMQEVQVGGLNSWTSCSLNINKWIIGKMWVLGLSAKIKCRIDQCDYFRGTNIASRYLLQNKNSLFKVSVETTWFDPSLGDEQSASLSRSLRVDFSVLQKMACCQMLGGLTGQTGGAELC